MAALDEVDERGWIKDYENSYAMHHKLMEATAEEVMELMARYREYDEAREGR